MSVADAEGPNGPTGSDRVLVLGGPQRHRTTAALTSEGMATREVAAAIADRQRVLLVCTSKEVSR